MDYPELVSDKKSNILIPQNKLILLILFSIFAPFILNAQKKADIGIMSGISYYMGDINPQKHFYNPSQFYGAFYRYNFHKRFSIKGGVSYASFSGSSNDFNSYISDASLTFNTKLVDVSAIFEYNFWPYLTTLTEEDNFSPYICAGIVGIYDLSASSIYYGLPFGAGFKYNINKRIGIGIEYSFRKTYTDMIDGSDLWDKKYNFEYTNDWYSFMGLFLTYKIYTKNINCPAYSN